MHPSRHQPLFQAVVSSSAVSTNITLGSSVATAMQKYLYVNMSNICQDKGTEVEGNTCNGSATAAYAEAEGKYAVIFDSQTTMSVQKIQNLALNSSPGSHTV